MATLVHHFSCAHTILHATLIFLVLARSKGCVEASLVTHNELPSLELFLHSLLITSSRVTTVGCTLTMPTTVYPHTLHSIVLIAYPVRRLANPQSLQCHKVKSNLPEPILKFITKQPKGRGTRVGSPSTSCTPLKGTASCTIKKAVCLAA